MARNDEPFKFLSNDEFERLTLPRKFEYLNRAFEALSKLHGKTVRALGERRKRRQK